MPIQASWERAVGYVGIAISAVHAQSFDCRKASTPAEQLICSDGDLKALDSKLASEFKAQQSNLPNLKGELLASEREWLQHRDHDCNDKGCLATRYTERIAELKKTTICGKIADRYKPLASAHFGEAPLQALATHPGFGVQFTPRLASLRHASTELSAWAAQQHPSFSISPDLMQSLKMLDDFGGDLEQAPTLNYYSLVTSEGTLHCPQYVAFSIRNGVAVGAPDPLPTHEDDDSTALCGMDLRYGTVDGVPVFLVDSYNYRPVMSATIHVSTWNADRFSEACSIELTYKPHFSANTLNQWEQSCEGQACDSLRKAAFKLAAAAQEDPGALRDESIEKLAPAHKAAWEQIVQKVGDSGSQEPDPLLIDVSGDIRTRLSLYWSACSQTGP